MAIFSGLNRKPSIDLRQLAMQSATPPPGTPVAGAGGMSPASPGGTYVNGQPMGPSANPLPEQLMKLARAAPQQNKQGGGLRRFAERFRNDILPRLNAAGAIAHGDYGAAAQIQGQYMRQAAERQQSEAAAEQFERMTSAVANLPGMTQREFLAYLNNPEQWASHNADALSTHLAAANVGQTETRVFGNPAQGGSAYQPPRLFENGSDQIRYDPATGDVTRVYQGMTAGEQYARSLGLQPGTPAWNQAVQDAELQANGPTAYGYDAQLEQVRQGNRMQLRGSPTYAQANPRAPSRRSSGGGRGGGSSRPRATNAAGQTVEWDGTQWRPVR